MIIQAIERISPGNWILTGSRADREGDVCLEQLASDAGENRRVGPGGTAPQHNSGLWTGEGRLCVVCRNVLVSRVIGQPGSRQTSPPRGDIFEPGLHRTADAKMLRRLPSREEKTRTATPSSQDLDDRIVRDFLIASHQAESFMQSLGDQHPVKRVTMVIRKREYGESVRDRDRQ